MSGTTSNNNKQTASAGKLGVRDLVVMNIVAVVSLSGLPDEATMV